MTANNPNSRFVAIYCRVSTLDQASGLEAQIRALTEFCQKQQIHNFLTFTDEGISGVKSSRPGLDQLMAKVREGQIEKVIV